MHAREIQRRLHVKGGETRGGLRMEGDGRRWKGVEASLTFDTSRGRIKHLPN